MGFNTVAHTFSIVTHTFSPPLFLLAPGSHTHKIYGPLINVCNLLNYDVLISPHFNHTLRQFSIDPCFYLTSRCVTPTYCMHRYYLFPQLRPPTHYLTSPPHAAASKKDSVSTNEAWDHFTDGWLIPQMHQPDQSPIYCLLISALRAALLSSRKKSRFTTKIWATIIVGTLCVCVFPYGWEGGSSPEQSLSCTLFAFISVYVRVCSISM